MFVFLECHSVGWHLFRNTDAWHSCSSHIDRSTEYSYSHTRDQTLISLTVFQKMTGNSFAQYIYYSTLTWSGHTRCRMWWKWTEQGEGLNSFAALYCPWW